MPFFCLIWGQIELDTWNPIGDTPAISHFASPAVRGLWTLGGLSASGPDPRARTPLILTPNESNRVQARELVVRLALPLPWSAPWPICPRCGHTTFLPTRRRRRGGPSPSFRRQPAPVAGVDSLEPARREGCTRSEEGGAPPGSRTRRSYHPCSRCPFQRDLAFCRFLFFFFEIGRFSTTDKE